MKANYAKPMLAVEVVSPTQPTTRECSDNIPKDRITLNDIATCKWDLGGGVTVFVGNSTCVLDGEQMQYACYNNPSEGNYIFRS